MDRLAALQAFLADDPDDPFTRFAIGQEHARRGADDDARPVWDALVRSHPDYVGTYYHLGHLHLRAGRTADAVAVFRDGIAAATRTADAHARAELQAALFDAEGYADV